MHERWRIVTEVVTGEAVALDLRTAALPSRVVAALADGVLQVLLLVVVVIRLLGFRLRAGAPAARRTA